MIDTFKQVRYLRRTGYVQTQVNRPVGRIPVRERAGHMTVTQHEIVARDVSTTTAPVSAAPTADRDAIRRHLDLIFGSVEYPDDAQLAISQRGSRGGLKTLFVPLTDFDKSVEQIARIAAKADVWIGVAPRVPGIADEGKGARGGREQCYGLPALFVDLDTADGVHAAKNSPTRTQVAAWITQCPLDISLVVDTGGGMHAWVALDEPLDHSTDAGQQILARWKQWWVAEAKRMDVDLDAGVIADVARVLRPAGTTNHKPFVTGPRAVTIVSHRSSRYSLAELDAALPALAAELFKHAARTVPLSEDDRPGTVMAKSLPVSRLLTDVFGWQAARGTDRWMCPVPGSSAHDNAQTYATDLGETVTLFDSTAQADWDLPGNDHRLTSWDLLIKVICKGDTAFAATLAAFYATNHEGLLDLLHTNVTSGGTPETLKASFASERARIVIAALDAATPPPVRPAPAAVAPAPTQRTRDAIPDGDEPEDLEAWSAVRAAAVDAVVLDPAVEADIAAQVEAMVAPVSITQAIKAWTGTQYPIAENVHAIVGGKHHGLWTIVSSQVDDDDAPQVGKKKITKTVEKAAQITTWVAYRSASSSEVAADGTSTIGKRTVTIVTAARKTSVLHDVAAADAINPNFVAANSQRGLLLPSDAKDFIAIKNMLSVLADDEREEVENHRYCAFRQLPSGKFVMMMPNGSVAADHIDVENRSAMPEGLEGQRGLAVLRSMGFVGAYTGPIAEAAKSVDRFVKIAPARPEIGITLLGTMWLAAIGASLQGTVMLFGDSDSLKSVAVSCLQAFWSAVPIDGKNLPMAIPNASKAGALRLAAWFGSSVPVIADDYRTTMSQKENDNANAVLAALAQGAYSNSLELKASGATGLRTSQTIAAPVIFTAEKAAESRAISNRMVTISINAGDIGGQWKVEGKDTIAEFRREDGLTGKARATLADYMSWIAGQLDTGTGIAAPHWMGQSPLEAMTQWADEMRLSIGAGTSGRAFELSAGFLTGWEAAWLWAADRGISDLLPTREQVTAAYGLTAASSVEAEAEANHSTILLEVLANMIASGAGHVTNCRGLMEWTDQDGLALISGYRALGINMAPAPQGIKIGHWSSDFKHILVNFASAEKAAKQRPATYNDAPAEIKKFMANAQDPEFAPKKLGDQGSRRLGIRIGRVGPDTNPTVKGSIPRGFPILASKLGMFWGQNEPETETD